MRQRIKIMRKFLVCMVTLLAMSMASVYADDGRYTRTAMLEQGDSIQLFYGQNAFQQAYTAAADSGAVITLSKGEFGSSGGDFAINKSIRIIGYYGFSNDPTQATVFSGIVRPDANNITLNGIYFGRLYIRAVNNLLITHSYISEARAYGYHYNTILNQCVVRGFDPNFFVNGDGIKITNSTLTNVGNNFINTEKNANAAHVLNCVIYTYDQAYLAYAMYENNIFIGGSSASGTIYLTYPSIYYYNLFCSGGDFYIDFGWGENDRQRGNGLHKGYEDVLLGKSYPANTVNPPFPFVGSDGTPVGPLGGSGFTDHPNIPRVKSQSIGLKPDDEGKLNVKITVSAE